MSDSTNTENNTPDASSASNSESGKKRSFLQRFRRKKTAESHPSSEADVQGGHTQAGGAEAGVSTSAPSDPPPATDMTSEPKPSIPPAPAAAVDHESAVQEKPKEGIRARFRKALSKTGRSLGNLFMGDREIDDELLEELETLLLLADVGIESTVEIIQELADKVQRRELADSRALFMALQNTMVEKLKDCEQPLAIDEQKVPFVLLVVGVNGVGKTTTIGKLARLYQKQGKSVMLAAGDTFRAAAVEQLQVWGERNNVPVVAQHTGADSASVIYDAIESAKSRQVDVLIADTAGRLHTKSNLMEELKKVKRVMAKLDDSAPHEVLLVLDAGTGQNAVNQMQEFNDTVEVTGVALTKLDGTAKGGIIFSLCKRFGIPVRYVGLGEGADDLQPFQAREYVSALFDSSDQKF